MSDFKKSIVFLLLALACLAFGVWMYNWFPIQIVRASDSCEDGFSLMSPVAECRNIGLWHLARSLAASVFALMTIFAFSSYFKHRKSISNIESEQTEED